MRRRSMIDCIASEENLRKNIVKSTLDSAIESLLKNGKSPQRKVGQLDNRGSHFYLAMYWARELANQSNDSELQSIFGEIASQLEGSKIFTKKLCKKYNIPTANFGVFDNLAKSLSFLKQCKFPIVVKADGLAAGKGVYICNNLNESSQTTVVNLNLDDDVSEDPSEFISDLMEEDTQENLSAETEKDNDLIEFDKESLQGVKLLTGRLKC